MTYECHCEDGPAQGAVFREYGPLARLGLPHDGRIIEYRLRTILDNRCMYTFIGPEVEQASP
jgi:hypothetical protein